MFQKEKHFKSGASLPSPGFGTWRIGENPGKAHDEVDALRHAIEVGFRHFDTAEMYGEGGSETVLGRAISNIDRDEIFLASKFYPHNASIAQMELACDQSLQRLGTDYLDLYMLHWPGQTDFAETVEGALRLKEAGKIRAFGISNFDTHGMREIEARGLAEHVEVNQVMYNISRRGVEFDLLHMNESLGIQTVAYTPLEPRRLAQSKELTEMAADLGLSLAQIALAWHMTRGAAVPIPKASQRTHIDALARAASVQLAPEVLDAIDRHFPAPTSPQTLDII